MDTESKELSGSPQAGTLLMKLLFGNRTDSRESKWESLLIFAILRQTHMHLYTHGGVQTLVALEGGNPLFGLVSRETNTKAPLFSGRCSRE